MITFNEDHLAEELAYIIENDLLLHAVETQLAEKNSVKVINNAKVQDIILSHTLGVESNVHLESGENFKAKLLVSFYSARIISKEILQVKYIYFSLNSVY